MPRLLAPLWVIGADFGVFGAVVSSFSAPGCRAAPPVLPKYARALAEDTPTPPMPEQLACNTGRLFVQLVVGRPEGRLVDWTMNERLCGDLLVSPLAVHVSPTASVPPT